MPINKEVVGAEADSLDWVGVSSSNVAAIAYSDDFARMYVEFTSGKRGVYHHVRRAVFDGWLAAPSKGKYLWHVVRNGGRDDLYPYDPL